MERVLVVDDDAELCQLGSVSFLTREGFEIGWAAAVGVERALGGGGYASDHAGRHDAGHGWFRRAPPYPATVADAGADADGSRRYA